MSFLNNYLIKVRISYNKICFVYVLFGINLNMKNGLRSYIEVPLYMYIYTNKSTYLRNRYKYTMLLIIVNFVNIMLKIMLLLDHPVHAPASRGDPWECVFPVTKNYKISPVNGVFNVYANEEDLANGKPIPYSYPDLATFVRDMNILCTMIADGPLKSFCYRRLSYLSSKFQLHVLLNELRELASQKAVPHRDFYNIRKVSMEKQLHQKIIIFL